MATLLQFVDSIAANPTVRLDLKAAPWSLRPGWDFSPPPLRKASASTLLADGAYISASTFDNRVLQIPLQLLAASNAAQITALQALFKELDRPTNLIRYQPDGAPSPVFFRTFRCSDPKLMARLTTPGVATLDLAVEAEPFALGLRQDALGGTATITNDPAAGTNRMFIDVANVLGDVATPALIELVTATGPNLVTVAAKATTTPATQFAQAESGALGTDTSSAASATGSGGNVARVTFATVATLATRTTMTVFTAANPIGRYRLLARVARNGGAATDDFQLRATMDTAGSTVTVTDLTGPQIVDLGVFDVGRTDTGGYGAALSGNASSVQLAAARTSGTGSLDIDYVFALPVDDSYCQTDFGTGNLSAGVIQAWLDGPNDSAYKTSGGAYSFATYFPRVGSLPNLSPGVTNRLYFVKSQTATSDVLGDTLSVIVYYWPRYLYVGN